MKDEKVFSDDLENKKEIKQIDLPTAELELYCYCGFDSITFFRNKQELEKVLTNNSMSFGNVYTFRYVKSEEELLVRFIQIVSKSGEMLEVKYLDGKCVGILRNGTMISDYEGDYSYLHKACDKFMGELLKERMRRDYKDYMEEAEKRLSLRIPLQKCK